MAMIEAATGGREGLAKRGGTLEGLVANDTLGAGQIVPTIARAAQAFANEDHPGCVQILESQAAEVVRIGGGAPREIVEGALLVALMRDGQAE